MKSKNTFRVIFATIFVLGTMAMNAQTKVYVHKTGGTDVTYNIADVDSISLNAPVVPDIPSGSNLLVNPGFEDASPATGGTLATLTPAGVWSFMTLADLQVEQSAITASTNANRLPPYAVGTTDAVWKIEGFIGVHGGLAAGRLIANNNSGMYQTVSVTPGKTYAFSAWVLHLITNSDTQTIHTEYVRIKSLDGSGAVVGELGNAPIGTDNNTWMQASGTTVTIPDGVTQVRFQISHYNGDSQAPATIVDDCDFHEVVQ